MTNFFIPNAFSLSGILLGSTCTILLLFLFFYGKSISHKIWLLFNISVAVWGFFAFLIGKSSDPERSLLLWKSSFVGVLFIPVFFYHFVCKFCNVNRQKTLIFVYAQAIFFLGLNVFTDLYISRVEILWENFYYLKSVGIVFPISFVIWLLLVVLGNFELIKNFNHFKGIQRNQALYFFLAFFVGFLGGTTNFFPMFNLDIYPYGNFTVTGYCVFITYAILKHRLLDVKVIITRTTTFVAVYSIVLGIPFALAFGCQQKLIALIGTNWWLIPLVSSTVLATIGPYIYFYIQKRAEDKLLQEQRSYQSTLRQASLGMGRIKDLKKLLQLIVHIVTRAVRLEHCEIYLLHEESNQFVLKASKGKRSHETEVSTIAINETVIDELKKGQEPIVYDEIKQKSLDYVDQNLINIESVMRGLDAALIVPSFIEERLIALVVLGKKKSGKIYSQDDLAVFSILANQSALAIENAQFYEDMKKTHEQLFRAEKMATIGTMADGLSHQINNRLHAMGFIAGDALDTVRLKKKDNITADVKDVLNEVEHALDRIQDNVKRGGEIVEGLLKYTRKGEEGFSAVNLDKLVDASIEMAQFKIKASEVDIVKKYDQNAPDILGNFTQIQEVFFNIIDNSYDSIIQRKQDLKEKDFMGRIEITAEKKGKRIEIIFSDNGMGVKDEDIGKLFTPFFTTKLSSKKGTGLGLYVIRQIIEENHGGKVEFLSRHKIGSQTQIMLPIAGQES